ncbi:MAG: peptidylprolyl isomerase [Candidatus Thermoplasmatota archaeon]|nr:peptidylprolyl isomerase [Candidatus Thermoplasmatota archaeon]
MRRSKMENKGASGLVPVFVLLGVLLVSVIGVVAFDRIFLVENVYPSDNGVYIDEFEPDYGEPFAVLDIKGMGAIKIKLNQDKAPVAVNNFMKLTNEGFYTGLTFHRVIPNFMIQGGDPSGDGTGGPGYTIEGEADNGLVHDRGVIACAKRGDDVRMSGSQFYIVHAQDGTHHLDGQHTVFGKVTQGMNVVDTITNVRTDANDKPLDPVLIERAYIVYE